MRDVEDADLFDDSEDEDRHIKFSKITSCTIRVDLTGGAVYCEKCNVQLIINPEYFFVCPSCCEVKSVTYDNAVAQTPHLPSNRGCDLYPVVEKKFYERLFYLNEKLAQNGMVEPKIPDDIFDLIQEEASNVKKYGEPAGFTKIHIREIIRSVVVPEELQIQYTSKPRPQNRWKRTRMTSLRRFTERWKSIKARLTGQALPTLSQAAYVLVQQYFGGYIRIWQYLGLPKSHSHFYHYNFIIIKTLQYLDYLYPTASLVDTFGKEWLLPTTKAKLEYLNLMWQDVICKHMNFKVCLPTQTKQELVSVNGNKYKIVYLISNQAQKDATTVLS